MKKILDDLPSGPVIFLGAVFALMPFYPEPHLWQKMMMIANAVPLKPIDWFDIAVHGGAGLLAIAKALRDRQVRAAAASSAPKNDAAGSGSANED